MKQKPICLVAPGFGRVFRSCCGSPPELRWLPHPQKLVATAPGNRQGRASRAGRQSPVRGHQPAGPRLRGALPLRRGVLCARRDGESDQGTAVVPVRRSHQLPDSTGEPIAVGLLDGGLRGHPGAARVWIRPHVPGHSPGRHDSLEAVQDRRRWSASRCGESGWRSPNPIPGSNSSSRSAGN